MNPNDPWDWTHQQPTQQTPNTVAPLAASQAQADPNRVVQNQPGILGTAGQMVEGRLLNKGLDTATDKAGTIWSSMTSPPVAAAVDQSAAETARLGLSNSLAPAMGAAGTAATEEGLMATLGGIAPYIPMAYMAGKAFKIW